MSNSTDYLSTERRNGQRAALLKGLTAAGGTGAALVLARRARNRKRSATERAQEAAKRLPDRARQLPDQWARSAAARMEEQEWRVWGLAALAATWLLLRFAEVRQLRKMNRILISRA
jgi:hypothetical protein